ncbi:MAG: ABC transporter permease [Anaerolineae bacterium]|nr:ABC transporter permease [Anaerolineae bacterium]
MTTPATSIKSSPPRTPSVGRFLRRNSLQLGIIGVLAVMWIFLMIAGPRTFLHKEIYIAFADSVPFYGIMAIPITLLVIAQEIDLSFGSIMAVSVMVFVGVFNSSGSPLLALVACLVSGTLVGLINGFIVVKIGIPSLITTIGTQFFWRGVVLVVTNASIQSVGPAEAADPVLHELLVGRLFGVIPAQFIWMVIIAIATWVLLNRHRFGAHVYLIGDNANSARLMGVNVDQRRIIMFGLVGLAAAFAGIITTYDIGTFFTSLGDGYLLQTLAAVFLGGTSVLGGTGSILGTFIGCYIIGAIEPGTVAINLTGFWTQLIYGLIIVVSVAMHTILRRRIK